MHIPKRITFAGIALTTLALVTPARAQSVDDLTAGVRVRVHGVAATDHGDKAYYLSGAVVGRDSTHVFVRQDGHTGVDTLPYFAMSHLESYRGTVSRQTMVLGSTAVGLLGGVALRLAYSLFTQDNDSGAETKQSRQTLTLAIPVFGVAGLIFGSVADLEEWTSIRPPGAFQFGR
jgi:hypothetical protein